jgi:hypothetical protein
LLGSFFTSSGFESLVREEGVEAGVKVEGVVVEVGAVVVDEEEALGEDVERGVGADEGALSGCASAGAGA